MHLLALGAFWQNLTYTLAATVLAGLNAPFGARCFLTHFPHRRKPLRQNVLMHLVVLGAFRLAGMHVSISTDNATS